MIIMFDTDLIFNINFSNNEEIDSYDSFERFSDPSIKNDLVLWLNTQNVNYHFLLKLNEKTMLRSLTINE